ncbi:fumarylacetoacetate hydrolase family protein [Tamlana crocina]|uniref:Fumarylacetoacetate hydrolase family protein n=1 Tax=Tamlana crocina TaxID=393006 RepID=A0ABX1DEE7_9FLAO|nr:fumarylacetoacetate hydrolase family protein [Tamlana crocina]NJX16703.1 fumarylacetoacetate hydrolase family protein [Tamlana crocina]
MKILAIGKNYVSTPDEISANKTGNQIIFSKPETSLVKNNQNVTYPSFTKQLNYEAELVIKIGKKGKDISLDNAASFISEIGIGIDFTAKDIFNASREHKGPWDLGKGFDGGAPISRFKPVTNFPKLDDINFNLIINGEEKQVGNTSLMIYNFSDIIAFTSKFMTLEPGDLIFTGTPASGTGEIHKGDHIQASIEGELLLDFKMV